jgi:uncharacterized membrane protein YcaP (DUF421 family)
MSFASSPDWAGMFSFSMSPLELIIRGSLMYWFIFFLLRAGGRRDVGSLGVADMLVLVLIADAAQNGMAGSYDSVLDGMILVATLVGWTAAVDRIVFHFPVLARLLTAKRVCLIQNGTIAKRNMRREFITEEELMSELRQQGFEDVAQVGRAYIEPDGNISVIPMNGARPDVGRKH